ncbi:MAG: extracellular solute-binding protein [Anaerolineae bacterium]|nr:extracellular solute-binding protein [Anaerolineae bacterium]
MQRFCTYLMIMVVLAVLSLTPALAQSDDAGVLNVYSSRHYGEMEAPFVAFTEATGIDVRVSAGSPQDLLGRLRADIQRGNRSIADVFLAIDAGVLSLAAEEGLLMPIESEVLNANVDESFRDPEGRWFGLSVRTRTAVYNPANVTEEELAQLNDYSDLANPTWQGRLCMRPASHIYTISLFSSLLYHLGEEEAAAVTQGIVSNVTRYINSDTSLIQAVAAGECDLTLVNHYYMGRLANGSPEDQAVFNSVAIRWMNQDSNGVFFNVNGAGIVKDAANYDNAVKFLEYMSAVENQCGSSTCFPGSNYELPTNPEAELNETVISFGEFVLDLDYPLWEYGAYQQAAVTMLEDAGFGFTEN